MQNLYIEEVFIYMKVWFVLSRFDNGGLERVVVNIVRLFTSRGLLTEVVVGEDRKIIKKSDDVPIFELPGSFALLKLFFLLSKILKEKPSHIFTTSNDYACFILTIKKLFLLKCKVIVTQHLSVSEPIVKSKGLKKIKLNLISWLMRLTYRYSDKVVAVSEGVRQDLVNSIGLDVELIEVIYNPVIDKCFYEKLNEAVYVDSTVFSKPTVVFVGRLSTEKRLDLIFLAMEMLDSKIDANLLVVGSGPLFDEYEQHIASKGFDHKWKLLGFVENPLPIIKRASVLVLASDFEGLPTVLIEALGCGAQIVSTNCPAGPSEILHGGKYGQLIPVGDVEALVNAIEKSLNGNFYVEPTDLFDQASLFSADVVIEKYMKLL
jgi:glycosyltransferase involved in cell wall biosynthesis